MIQQMFLLLLQPFILFLPQLPSYLLILSSHHVFLGRSRLLLPIDDRRLVSCNFHQSVVACFIYAFVPSYFLLMRSCTRVFYFTRYPHFLLYPAVFFLKYASIFSSLLSLIAALFSMVLVSAVYVIIQQTQSPIYFEDTRVYISSDTFVYI